MVALSNGAFLRTIFGPSWRDALVASFRGDPGAPPPGAWAVRPAGQHVPEDAGANSYFCISTFHAGAEGKHRRRADAHKSTHVIVVDDVGEKLVSGMVRDKLGAPSYRLRTSPGSEQWGYLMDLPEPDAARVDALLDGLVQAAMNPRGTDPGMKGVTRLVRLPVGRNGKAKHGPGGAACVLLEWAPERTFTMNELAEAVGLDLAAVQAGRMERRESARPGAAEIGPDPVLDMLTELGRVKHELDKGKWEITCPFVDTHTGGVDNGAAYLGDGCFKCHHGHCENRPSSDFRTALDDQARADRVPTIGAREFEADDAAILARLREYLAGGAPLTRSEMQDAAWLPRQEVQEACKASGVVLEPRVVQALRRRLARARSATVSMARARMVRRISTSLPPAPGYVPPVPIEEIRAAQKAFLREALAGAWDALPAPLPRRRLWAAG